METGRVAMAETNGNQNTRLDRIEKALELMINDHE
jgi:hypothetical protein